jgi:hypothetical protein
VNSGHFTIRKGGGEARRLKRVLVEPEADRVLGFMFVLLVLDQGNAASSN